jgi:adenylate kinase
MKSSKPVIIFLGMSGTGKSTQAHLFSRAYGFTRIGAGERLRKLATEGEAHLRQQAESLLLKGSIVPDEIATSIMLTPIQDAYGTSKGFIIDGAPRNLSHANILNTGLKELGKHTIRVIYFDISLDQMRERVAQRLICKSCYAPSGYPGHTVKCDFCESALVPRMDDVSDTMEKRWREYVKQTEPLIQEYDCQGKLIHINAARPIHIVFADIVAAFTPWLYE